MPLAIFSVNLLKPVTPVSNI